MVKLIIKLIFTIFLLNSCSMQTDNSNNYKVVDRIYTKNKESFIFSFPSSPMGMHTKD